MTQLKPFDDLFAVPIPKEAHSVCIRNSKTGNNSTLFWWIGEIKNFEFDNMYWEHLGGNFKHLFTTESATAQDWAGVAEKDYDWDVVGEPPFSEFIKWDVYKDYNSKDNWPFELDTATESGHSLLAANGLEGNYAIVKKCEMGCPA